MKMLPALAGALALLCTSPLQAGAAPYLHKLPDRQDRLDLSVRQQLIERIHAHRQVTWHWQKLAHVTRTSTIHREWKVGIPVLHRLVHYWGSLRHRSWRTYVRAEHERARAERERARERALAALPPHYQQWLCIHSYEGSWTDPGSPYYGGLQFGYSEWQRFGKPYTGAETADQASPLEQMWAAERYWHLSGFWPWPNTAARCGLL